MTWEDTDPCSSNNYSQKNPLPKMDGEGRLNRKPATLA